MYGLMSTFGTKICAIFESNISCYIRHKEFHLSVSSTSAVTVYLLRRLHSNECSASQFSKLFIKVKEKGYGFSNSNVVVGFPENEPSNVP